MPTISAGPSVSGLFGEIHGCQLPVGGATFCQPYPELLTSTPGSPLCASGSKFAEPEAQRAQGGREFPTPSHLQMGAESAGEGHDIDQTDTVVAIDVEIGDVVGIARPAADATEETQEIAGIHVAIAIAIAVEPEE